MKLFLLTRGDAVGWDEFVGFVIRAERKETALEIANKQLSKWEITELNVEGPQEIILDSFNAG